MFINKGIWWEKQKKWWINNYLDYIIINIFKLEINGHTSIHPLSPPLSSLLRIPQISPSPNQPIYHPQEQQMNNDNDVVFF